MGMDLERPSGQYPKECIRPNVNVNMMDCHDQRQNRDDIIVDSPDISANDKENTESIVGSRVSTRGNKTYAGDWISLNSLELSEPHDGMEFESKEEAFSFYKEYAKSVGFDAIIKASRRSRISGKFIDAKFVCTRYGSKREASTTELPQPVLNTDGTAIFPVKKKRGRTSHSWAKTDCKACMHVKRSQRDGRWVVCSFIKEHNHENFPDQAYYFRSHRKLDLGNSNVGALHTIRARTMKMYVAMAKQSGGNKKRENKKGRLTSRTSSTHLALEEGDIQIMFDHFLDMQDENPNFFYAIDLNEEQRLRNVLWIDAKSRLDYGYFGDVVLFDTMHIKNECKLPFAPFVGVNHHFQLLLFGCALIADESKSTYVWLMRAWLRAMGGHAPRVILTDQDNVLKEAIAEVFPNSQHCFGLWHILRKIPEKLSHVVRQHENFTSKFNKCILKSQTSEQFEKKWWKMVERFNLRNDEWFQSLYDDRQKWIPTYMTHNFLAGMSTAQRSEGINSFLDKYIQRKTTLKDLLEQYKGILQDKFEEEAKADFETWHKQPGLKSPSPFEKQLSTLYTHAIFKKFQVEVLGVVACHPRQESENGETKTFKVQDFEQDQYFFVMWNQKTSHLSCSCRLFEFNGFLCRHVLIVMQLSGMHRVPAQYILRRWTKDAKGRLTIGEKLDVVNSRVQRYNDLCRQAIKVGDEGSLSQESYSIAFSALEEALKKCEIVNNSIQNAIEPTSPSSNCLHNYKESSQDNEAPSNNKKSNISNKRQVQPEPEVITLGMHDSWQQMEQLNSRAATLNEYFSSQHIAQGMGQLKSTNSIHDDYFSNQHGVQGLGQLNSIAPIHEAHYMTQQRIRGMSQLHYRSQGTPSCFELQGGGLHEMDQPNAGNSQLRGMASKHWHSKHLSQ